MVIQMEKPGLHKRAMTECESELFVHSEHSEMSDNDDDNSRLEDEVDDVTEEDDDSDDE